MAAHPPEGPRPIVIERSRETRPSAAPPSQPLAAQTAAGQQGPRTGHGKNRRPAAQFPLLRQPAKISAVRQHVQREVGSRASCFRRACASASTATRGAGVRRRRRRRIGADPGDARDARSLQPHALLHRRQGDQPRGRRLTLQKMSDRFFEHPSTVLVLTNLAMRTRRGSQSNRSTLHRAWCGTSCRWPAIPRTASNNRSWISSLSWRRIGRLASARVPATRFTSARSCSSSIVKTTASCSIRSFPSPAARSPTTLGHSIARNHHRVSVDARLGRHIFHPPPPPQDPSTHRPLPSVPSWNDRTRPAARSLPA